MTIAMEPRRLHLMFHIDTNRLNARQKLETMNQIEKWANDDVILINMSGTAHTESRAGSSTLRTRKANSYIFTIESDEDGPAHDAVYRRIEEALFPGGAKDQNQRNDVTVIYEAHKYGALLITNDGGSKTQPGGILGNRDKLKGMVRIFSDVEAVDFIRSRIRERDEMNRRIAREFALPLPEWTGKD